MSKKSEKEVNNSQKPESSANSLSEQSPEIKVATEKKENKKKEPEQKSVADKQIELEKKFNDLQQEIGILKEKNLRLLADLDNQRKEYQAEMNREKRMMSEKIKYGNEKLLKQLLFFPDNYEKAMEYGRNESDPKLQKFLLGFQMILTEFKNVLKRNGVTEIKITPLTDIYDDKLHGETLEVEFEENNIHPAGTILEVSKKGYLFYDRVLRPATVKISRTKKEAEIKNEKK
ncbi:MAG: nucleotide exchange factor GrpE [Candidatus Moeniiplasma glomeromycotorum]|nr:nucleotide exchange factor GrpE [Candidatus Moeniiplasma glomeromycotorum]MCE8168258.1 nucleotide exchange factor GrpE [Candidatus Moeniiplasma glomeromycotorum]MCE8170010.1 nucleotide exchange factor GrpE [Candidatus Moeniiplasma glomeromycotorum]